jgi:hypothetical protein
MDVDTRPPLDQEEVDVERMLQSDDEGETAGRKPAMRGDQVPGGSASGAAGGDRVPGGSASSSAGGDLPPPPPPPIFFAIRYEKKCKSY